MLVKLYFSVVRLLVSLICNHTSNSTEVSIKNSLDSIDKRGFIKRGLGELETIFIRVNRFNGDALNVTL